MDDMAVLASRPGVAAALAHIEAADAETVADMATLTSIPAPSGSERERGAWLTARLRGLGLHVDEPDAVGNIRARIDGDQPAIMLASHLDTVFDATTDLTISRRDHRIYAPGIADNGRGVAALIRLASALQVAKERTHHAIELVGTVGEEGAGDLRGVKHLFANGGAGVHAFVAVDGAGITRIVHRAVGSRRLRITINGPGGHSWVDRGTAHPIHALSAAISSAIQHVAHPQSSFSVGRIEGGTGINVIPHQAHADIDIRSESTAELERVERALRHAIEDAVESANAQRITDTAALTYAIQDIGNRPGGSTDSGTDVVKAAIVATRYCNAIPELVSSSTDANVPMSIGIPSIAIGAGGDTGGMHTTNEWYSNEGGVAGLRRLLLLTLALARPIPD